jgi:acetyltransferase-like isoleucine patch superfamily enzyme
LVGIGASMLPGCSVGAWAKVGAGAVVIRDIPAHSISVGIPAKETGRRDGRKD